MKNSFVFFHMVCLVVLIGCRDNSDRNAPNNKEDIPSESLDYELADIDLQFEQEKIALLAELMNLPIGKTNSIVREYLAKSWSLEFDSDKGTAENYGKIMDTISKMYDLPKKRIAAIIFSYRYEMITSDDYFEEFQTEYENSMEYRDTDDSRY